MRQNTQYTAGLAALYAVCALAAPARAQFPGGSFELHDVHISPAVIVEDQPITVTVRALSGQFAACRPGALRSGGGGQ